MEHVGIDLGKNQSHVCVLSEDGSFYHRRIETSVSYLRQMFGKKEKKRILIEASTESEWVARCLEEMGHEVVVADPNYAPMYAHRTRRIKTDRRDAHALAVASYLGAYREAHRCSDERRHVRALLASRDALVRTRSRYIFLMGALLRREGHRVGGGGSENYAKRVGALKLSDSTRSEVGPLLSQLPAINEQVHLLDTLLEQIATKDVVLLSTAPGIGLVTSSAFVSVIDNPARFASAHQVESYLGMVPSEYSSVESQHRGHITKQGNSRVRWMLVQAAWVILRSKNEKAQGLKTWGLQIAQRRGSKIAAVAVARRLAGILWDQKAFFARPYKKVA